MLVVVATAIAYAWCCKWLAEASLVTFSVAFNFGSGVGFYLVINELLPDRIRAVGYPAVSLALSAFAGLLWIAACFCLPRTPAIR